MIGASRVNKPHILAGCVGGLLPIVLSVYQRDVCMKGINRVNMPHILAGVGGFLPIVLSVNQHGV